jgi:hypothetical protein
MVRYNSKPSNEPLEGVGNNLQEALEDYAKKVKRLSKDERNDRCQSEKPFKTVK